MERDAHHTIGCVEGLLYAVAVMDVDIDVQHTLVMPRDRSIRTRKFKKKKDSVLEQLEDGKNDVVNIAEAGGLRLLCVMETTWVRKLARTKST